ncbi:MAG TPA: arginine deiminase family protein [Tenuifilaceae bacterium]|nr:arginine deiminase family protein [Tenuifilaceae bacterium]HPE19491.1 arginine deiminase family protein [Tenuifilaceae bacterium]HPJ46980.1 arginine deiminase family protein [Tenuifilaceae bacterium]HPQ35487.1 arginine deiminase family protein [Tenuifilaceae bacterium]HRX69304.1 arginine deiminase family protein [Tenuifilaceae bacterium]
MHKHTKAIVRQPGKNFANGISTSALGKPSYELALKQHNAYCEALQSCGLEVIVLPADEKFPDGCFVEDTAVVTSEVAIITKPGDTARVEEVDRIAEVLSKYKKTETINLPGTLDGGDIMRVGNHFYIGMSKRTNEEGATQLASILAKYGYTSSQIPVKSVLHLKTGITCLGNNNFISVEEFANVFKESNVIKLDPDEFYSANCLKVNDYLLIPKGFPKSKKQIVELGYNVIEIEMTEFRKMDGGLTCLSLLF